ncbi:MAG: Zn-dependent oligopeptidase [Methanoregula sp.]|nr:Zn-dependent oligopeptidase [Methanoregula sp.]
MNRKVIVTLVILFALIILAANYLPNGPRRSAPGSPSGSGSAGEPVQLPSTPGEVTSRCDAAIADANALLDAIAAIPPGRRTTENTLLAYEQVMADFDERILPLSLTSYVSPDPAISAEGAACEQKSGTFSVGVTSRRDLYDAIRSAEPRNPNEARLAEVTLRKFVKSGLALPDDRLAKVRAAKERLTLLESEFSTNLNNEKTTIVLTQEELAGVPAEALATFTKTGAGTYIVTTKYPDYYALMQHAKRSDIRKRLYSAFVNRQADANTKLLEEAILLRQAIARELGYATWADYRVDGRMAETKENVLDFLARLKAPLRTKTQAELAGLLAVKRGIDPDATAVYPWDLLYLEEKLIQQRYSLDSEKVREYFPLDRVTRGIFDQFAGPLGVRFTELPDAPVWAPGVKLYRVGDATDGRTLAYLYLDLFPRDGKYGHTMITALRSGRELNGSYVVPVTVIIGNMRGPSGKIPSLLSHDDVVSLFHEFGHTMHQSLTTVPYASLSGTNVEWDFVESPSQAFEKWAWQPQVIEAISGNYRDPSQKMPAEMVQKIVAARDMSTGLFHSRQLVNADEDMIFHTANGPVDVTAVWRTTYAEIMGMEPIEGGHEPASFGHLMGGYDAGYYSYLWSKVYALNIFDRFRHDGLANATTGAEYRRWILSQGNMQDGKVLLKGFLGREPGVDMLYENLGIAREKVKKP